MFILLNWVTVLLLYISYMFVVLIVLLCPISMIVWDVIGT